MRRENSSNYEKAISKIVSKYLHTPLPIYYGICNPTDDPIDDNENN